ncbi:MAG: thiol reductant ABC exporter subunit CydD, partial [Pseudonocardia sp.]|nr:thiol reductant ABC exporter subunit CydD [Pseudonocardia sp.]
ADLAAIGAELGLLAGIVGLRAVLAYAQETAAVRASAAVKSQLRRALLRRVVALGPSFLLEGRRSGELAQLATRGVDAVDPYFARYLPQLVLTCLVPPMFVLVIGITDRLSGLIVLGTLPVVVTFLVLIGRATQARNRAQWRSLERLSRHFLDVVDGLPTLRVFGRARAQQQSIAAVTDQYRRTTMGVLRVSFLSSFVLELAASLSVAVVAVQIGLRLLAGDLQLRPALLVLLLAPDVYLPLRQLGGAHHAAEEGRAATSEVLDVLDLPTSTGSRRGVPAPNRRGLEVRGITVREARRLAPLSLDVVPGELVAVVGASGVGKSTLLAVLLGFVEPDAGTVRLNGSDLADSDPTRWRPQIAWVPQRPALLPGSVAQNVALGVDDASAAEVRRALALAAAEDIDLQRMLGEDGAGLSAGERQRITVARAFLRAERGADLLLLDEPTAHLDGPTRDRLLAGLRHLAASRCALMVVHDPVLAAAADRVVCLPNGDERPGAQPSRHGVVEGAVSGVSS